VRTRDAAGSIQTPRQVRSLPPQGHVQQASEQLSAAGQHARDFITHLFFGSPDMQAAMEAFAVREQVSVAQQTSPFFSGAAAIGSSAGLAAAAADASSWSVQSVTCGTVPAAAVADVLTSSADVLGSDEASTTVEEEAAAVDEQPAVIQQSEAAVAGSERVHEHTDRLDTPMKPLFTQEQHGQGAAANETESVLHCDHSDSDDVQTTTSAASIPPRLLRRLSQRG
jgi:hypothetical protein